MDQWVLRAVWQPRHNLQQRQHVICMAADHAQLADATNRPVELVEVRPGVWKDAAGGLVSEQSIEEGGYARRSTDVCSEAYRRPKGRHQRSRAATGAARGQM